MDVSVCIVNWNTRDLLYRCLDSIKRSTEGLRYEVVVVDNNSADGSADMVSAEFPECILIASKENLGFARGSNLAAQAASGAYVFYLNPDTELVSNAILGMFTLLEATSGVGAVGCKLLNADGSIQFTCASTLPSPRSELVSLLGFSRLFPHSRICSARELDYWDHKNSAAVECLSGACMMLPRALVERLGGFDESFFMYGEDLDLCCRIRREGFDLYYLASESILHHEGAGSSKRGRSFAPLMQREANYRLLRNHFGRGRAIGYRTAVLLGSFTRVLGISAIWPLLLCREVGRHDRISDLIAKHVDLLLWSIGIKRGPLR